MCCSSNGQTHPRTWVRCERGGFCVDILDTRAIGWMHDDCRQDLRGQQLVIQFRLTLPLPQLTRRPAESVG